MQGGDGYFFELEGTTMGIVYRTASSGSQVDTRVVQSSWNIDTFDGNGPSRITITTWDDAYLLIFDQQWLGVGQVRIGLIIEGIIRYAHIFTNEGLQLPYTRTAKLPIRYEIENVSAGATSDEMRMMCQSVLMEAQPSLIYPQFTFEDNVDSLGAREVFLSLRLKASQNRVTLRLVDVSVVVTNNATFRTGLIEVVLNPTLQNDTWAQNPSPFSAAELDNDFSTTFTGGTLIAQGQASQGGVSHLSITSGGNRSPYFDINSDIAGTSDILSLIGSNLAGSPNVSATMTWIEIS
uniref:Uncharacterized protein n=1 Tax=Pithovirus LCPAC304 TaxID=2506594 RepID=A0A481Z8H0_9VIRU|nr:MAG: hypothetical protein LCPAC304_05500 [Pithovirus LCPAC304]